MGLFKINEMTNFKKLHLGCGNIRLDGFVNIDIKESSAVDRQLDIRKLDYPDNSIEIIYCCHVLEHFTSPEVKKVLAEWHRVLAPGGNLAIVVPNLNRWILRYLLNPLYSLKNKLFFRKDRKNEIEIEEMLIADLFAGEPDYSFNSYHKTGFNPRIIKKIARGIGFKKIEKISLKSSKFPTKQVKRVHWSSMVFLLSK
jgi:ubiquinone/menaquinone biosynthesis C-methylase UbiE